MFLNLTVHDKQNTKQGSVILKLDFGAKQWSITTGQQQGWAGVGFSNPSKGSFEVKDWGVIWLWDQRAGEHHTAIIWDAPTSETDSKHSSGQGRLFDPKDPSFKDGRIEWTAATVPSADFPPPPSFRPLFTTAERQSIFGKFAFSPDPKPKNPEQIKIHGNWVQQNIISVAIPQMARAKVKGGQAHVSFHRLAAKQLMALWVAWEQTGLLNRVLTWHGSFVPRFVRGSKKDLSNHAFGTAFDINVAANGFGKPPAKMFTEGCVRELVPIANQLGFYWGGHFTRPDGMHFEVARVL